MIRALKRLTILLLVAGLVCSGSTVVLASQDTWSFPTIGFGNGRWQLSVGVHFWKDHLHVRNLQLGADVDLGRGLRLHSLIRSNGERDTLRGFSPRADELFLEAFGFREDDRGTLSVSLKLGRSRYLRFPYPDAISLFDQVPGVGDLEGGEYTGYSGLISTVDYSHRSGLGLHGTYIKWGFGVDRPSGWAEAYSYYHLDSGPWRFEARYGEIPVRPEPLGRTARGVSLFAGRTFSNGNSVGFLYEDSSNQEAYTGILVSFAPGDTSRWMGELAFDYTRSPMGHAMQIPLMGGTIGRVERFKGGQSAPFRGILMRAGEDGWMEPTDWVLVGEVYAERIRTYWQNGHARNFYEHRLGSWGVTDERGLRVVMEEEPWYLQLESLVSPHTSFRSWDDLQTWERDRQGPAQLSQKVTYRFYRKR